jgi:hypothetical protein
MSAETDGRKQALSEVGDALCALSANLIGIVRGAGKPLELSMHVDAFTAALGAFEGATGEHPKAWEFADMLRVDLEPKGQAPATADEMAELYARHDVIQASLQLAAARLLKQEAGAAEALAELHKALAGLEDTKRRIAKRREGGEEPIRAQMKGRKPSDRPS